MIEISVIIPTYNREKLLVNVLESLIEQKLSQDLYEIIVVDDGSEDIIADVVEKFKGRIKYLKYLYQEHKGLPSARNFGIKNARGRFVAFTDTDCIVNKNWLYAILEGFRNSSIVGITGKVITNLESTTPFTHQVITKGRDAVGCNMAFRKSTLMESGGFDEEYAFVCEDTDFFLRAQKYGSILFNKDMIVRHPPLQQTPAQFIKKIGKICEGQFMLCKKHPTVFLYRRPLLGVIRVVGIRMFWEDLRRNKRFFSHNPFLYLFYFFSLLCQRIYFIYFLFLNYKRLSKGG